MEQETSTQNSRLTVFYFGNHGPILKSLTELLEPASYSITHLYSKDLPEFIDKISCDSVIYTISGKLTQADIENLKLLKKQDDLLPVIVITDDTCRETETKIRQQGIMYFFTVPFENAHLISIIKSGSALYRKKTNLYTMT